MPKKATKTEAEAKTPEDDFSTVHEFKGNSYDLSNSDAVKDLLARFSGPHKCDGLVKGLIKSICHKKLPKSCRDYQVRQIERLTLSDEDYNVKLAKQSERKARYTPSSYFIFQDEIKSENSSLTAKDVKSLWDGLSASERKVYTDKAAELKKAKLKELSSSKKSSKKEKKTQDSPKKRTRKKNN